MSNDTPQAYDPFDFTPEQLQAAADELKSITPQDFLELKTGLELYAGQLTAGPLPEADNILYMDLTTADGDTVCYTSRGRTPEVVFSQFTRGVRLAKKAYGLIGRQKRMNQARANAPAAPQVPNTPQYVPVTGSADPGITQLPLVAAPAGVTPDGKGHWPGQTFVEGLAALEITPLANGKVKVGFVPYLRNGRAGDRATTYEQLKTPEEWAAAFGVYPAMVIDTVRLLTADDFKVAGRYAFAINQLKVEYEVSTRQNGRGNYYINVKRLGA